MAGVVMVIQLYKSFRHQWGGGHHSVLVFCLTSMVYIYRTFYVSMEALRLLSSQCYKTILGVISTNLGGNP